MIDFQRGHPADNAVLPQQIDYHDMIEDFDAEPSGLPDQPLEEPTLVTVAGKHCTGHGIAGIGK